MIRRKIHATVYRLEELGMGLLIASAAFIAAAVALGYEILVKIVEEQPH